MSDLFINIRFGTRYLQISKWKVDFNKGTMPLDAFNTWCSVYQFFWYSKR